MVSVNEQEQVSAHLRHHIKALFAIEDTSGIELFSLIHLLSNLSEALECQQCGSDELSGPRWRLMVRLFAEESLGNREGVTPTSLSHFQRVSKNTISSLLRGLEDQGLIQRTLDPQDYRLFRIQLTQAGRDLIRTTAPERLAGLNRMAACLDVAEREQLVDLLEKLQHSLMATAHQARAGEKVRLSGPIPTP